MNARVRAVMAAWEGRSTHTHHGVTITAIRAEGDAVLVTVDAPPLADPHYRIVNPPGMVSGAGGWRHAPLDALCEIIASVGGAR